MPKNKKGEVLRKDESVTKTQPAVPNKKIFRSIRFKSDIKTLVVRTEIGYDLVFELHPQIRVAPYESTEKGTPEFQTSIVWKLKGARPRGNAMKVPQIKDLVKDRSLLPMDGDWDIAQLGYVYSNNRDPNNHRWWLEALKSTGQGIGNYDSTLSEYMFDISSTAPIGTRAWFDGIHHGRFIIQKDNIKDVIEISPGKVTITGNGKGKLGDIKGNVDIPEGSIVLRLRFDIRKNVWYSEFLDSKGVVLKMLESTNIMSDVKFKSHTIPHPSRPKVSGMIMVKDIDKIKTDNQLTMIKGKV